MKKVRRQKKLVSRGEKILYTIGALCFVMTMVIKIFCGASIGHLNLAVEKVKYEIDEQAKKKESLTMKVDELTSFDNVKDIVKDMGLAYNNSNIIVVGD